jgi:hypothetical protein
MSDDILAFLDQKFGKADSSKKRDKKKKKEKTEKPKEIAENPKIDNILQKSLVDFVT